MATSLSTVNLLPAEELDDFVNFAFEFTPSTDRPMFDEGIERATGHAERAKTLVSLPMPALVALLADASTRLDTPWLQSALDIGAFDFSREIIKEAHASHSLTALDAALSFLRNMEETPYRDNPLHGVLGHERTNLNVNGCTAFNAFFGDLVTQTLVARQRSIEQYESRFQQCAESELHPQNMPELNNVLGRLLMGACALNLPIAVRDIVQCLPHTATSAHSLASMGERLSNYQTDLAREKGSDFSFTPYFYAMQLNRTECMQAMLEASGLDRLPLSYEKVIETVKTEGHQGIHGYIFGQNRKVTTLRGLDVIDTFKLMTPVCMHSVLTMALHERLLDQRPRKEGGPSLQTLHELAIQALADDSWQDRTGSCKRSFIDCGAYRIDSTKSVIHAINNGHPDVVLAAKEDADWAAVFAVSPYATTMTHCVFNSIQGNSSARYSDALLIAAQAAVAQGHGQCLLSSVPIDNTISNEKSAMALGTRVAEPMASLVLERFNDVLLVMIEAGLPTHQPLHPGTKSVLAMAEAVNPEMVSIIASFHARAQCRALLEDLEDAPSAKTPSNFSP